MAPMLLWLLPLLIALPYTETTVTVPLQRSSWVKGGLPTVTSLSRHVPMPSFAHVRAHARGAADVSSVAEDDGTVTGTLFTFPFSQQSAPPHESHVHSLSSSSFHPNDSTTHLVPLTSFFSSVPAYHPTPHHCGLLYLTVQSSPCSPL